MNDNRVKIKLTGIKMPLFSRENIRIPFIGLGLITGALKDAGYSVSQIDLNAISVRKGYYYQLLKPRLSDVWPFERVVAYLHGSEDRDIEEPFLFFLNEVNLEGVNFILLSVGHYDDYSSWMTLCFGKYIKKHFPAKVIIGGEASGTVGSYEPIYYMFNELAGTDCLDYYIRGYGEAPLLSLLSALECSGNIVNIPGLYYFDSEQKVKGTPPSMKYKVHLPDYGGLLDEWYTWKPSREISRLLVRKNQIEARVLLLTLIYGCPNRCAFCVSSKYKMRGYLNHVDPSYFAEGVSYLSKTFDTRYFLFNDNIFNISRSFVVDICQELIQRKVDILWADCAQFRGWTKDLLKLARQAGCIRLYFGLETGSPRLQRLINYNKVDDLKHAREVLRWSHELGIFNGIEVITGFPTETDEDIAATINFIRRNREYIDEVTLNMFYLIGGSLMYTNPADYGIENIRRVKTGKSEKEEVYHSNQVFEFDEISGLKWAEKRKQIRRSYRLLWECLSQYNLIWGQDDRLHVMFVLYDRWDNKAEIRKRYLAWLWENKKLY